MDRLGTIPFQMMTGREPRTVLMVLANDTGSVRTVQDELWTLGGCKVRLLNWSGSRKRCVKRYWNECDSTERKNEMRDQNEIFNFLCQASVLRQGSEG